MLKDFAPPTRVEECRNTAEILRELAAQLRFYDTRHLLVGLAEELDSRASLFERREGSSALGGEKHTGQK